MSKYRSERHPSEVYKKFFTQDSPKEADEAFNYTVNGDAPAAPVAPKSMDADVVEFATAYRIRGYLDCLDGLIQDGYPDEKFIAYLCEKVGRDVPPPFFDRIMDENAALRRALLEAQGVEGTE